MRVLLCVNGALTAHPAITYGIWLAALMETEVSLLGVVEAPDRRPAVENQLDEASRQLEEAGIPYQRLAREGACKEVVAAQAATGEYLTVVGRLDRPPLRRWLRGRSIRRLLQTLEAPLFYVPAFRPDLKRMLLCLGGIGRSVGMVQVARQLAEASQAEVTLLHVVERASFDYPPVRAAQDDWQQILSTETVQARHLRAALEGLQAAGLSARLRVQQGYVTEAILREIQAEDYDLVGLGSHYSAKGLRPLFAPNVTINVAEGVDRPVLIAR